MTFMSLQPFDQSYADEAQTLRRLLDSKELEQPLSET